MPTLPSVNHSREESLPHPVPDSAVDPRAASSSSTADSFPATDPLVHNSTYTGSVVGSISRRNRRSFAALAQRTSSAIASLSSITTPTTTPASSLRASASTTSLSKPPKLSATPLTPPLSDEDTCEPLPDSWRPYTPDTTSHRRCPTIQCAQSPPLESRPSQSGSALSAPSTMHQTSSRLLRMTEDERPFTKVGLDRAATGTME